MDEVFALNLLIKEHIKIPKNIQLLIEEREQARKSKNWKLADDLRNKITKLGYFVSDTSEGPVVKNKQKDL